MIRIAGSSKIYTASGLSFGFDSTNTITHNLGSTNITSVILFDTSIGGYHIPDYYTDGGFNIGYRWLVANSNQITLVFYRRTNLTALTGGAGSIIIQAGS